MFSKYSYNGDVIKGIYFGYILKIFPYEKKNSVQ